MKTQHQMFYSAQKDYFELAKDAGFLCGTVGNNNNPLFLDEIEKIANSSKPYAGIFRNIFQAMKKTKNPDY